MSHTRGHARPEDTRRNSQARRTADERSVAPSFVQMRRMWVLTVFSEIESLPMISGLVRLVGR